MDGAEKELEEIKSSVAVMHKLAEGVRYEPVVDVDLVGAPDPRPSKRSPAKGSPEPFSFVVVLENRSRFRITPDLQKLKKELWYQEIPEQSLSERFRTLATRSILAETKRGPNASIEDVVFAKITGRDDKGVSFYMPFKIGDYAVVERLE